MFEWVHLFAFYFVFYCIVRVRHRDICSLTGCCSVQRPLARILKSKLPSASLEKRNKFGLYGVRDMVARDDDIDDQTWPGLILYSRALTDWQSSSSSSSLRTHGVCTSKSSSSVISTIARASSRMLTNILRLSWGVRGVWGDERDNSGR